MGCPLLSGSSQNKFTSGAGANDFGGQRAALDYLTTIYGKFNRLPSEDFIKLQFKSHFNPHIIYTVTVPYVSGYDEDCWKLGIKLYKSLPSKLFLEHLKRPESTNMGIIKLDGFSPEDVGTMSLAVLKAVMIVRSLLVNELKDTKSVIYDLRGNPGGDVEFADNMVQLFKPDFEPFGDRYLMNPITQNIFVNKKDPNGHGAGTIFGEDGQTGGAGATVKKLDPFLIRASPDDFKKFPFSQELTSGPKTYANTLTVGVTQTVRTGLYNGQDIEDAGIKTDTVVRPQWSDLQFGSPTNTQYDRIAESLARTGQERSDPIIIVGKTAGEQVLKTKRNVRIIPSDENHMKISTREFIFEGTSDSVGLYQSPTTAPADGWNNLKGPWMIGNGIQYAKNIDSSIEAFFSAPIGTKINIV
ncbi:hypothetical protein BASA83_012576 [Batrachochytrium salamandrivorans]|nr:hypothetical protein BASA83_012576 [Batrachochytrium salamandrivorans]